MNIITDEQISQGLHKWSDTHNNKDWTLFCGNAVEALQTLDKESVDCIITSPPYYNRLVDEPSATEESFLTTI